jgi:hypothetical protein
VAHYTRFSFDVVPESSKYQIIEAIEEHTGLDFEDKHSWYDYLRDMQEISRLFPYAIITVTGVGEEAGDYWRMYCLNGDCEKVLGVISYPPCPFELPPTAEYKVVLNILGRDIAVTVEGVEGESPESLRAKANQRIRESM